MKTNHIPAIIMLSAGFIVCICNIHKSVSLFDFTRQLLIVLVVFWIIGLVVKAVLDKAMAAMADKKNEDTNEEGEEVTSEKLENIDSSEIK
jgi:phosphotransferase system  glucose/maltose/N-acetylglucosamine-specific IIC component